jgi:hypothetical protein
MPGWVIGFGISVCGIWIDSEGWKNILHGCSGGGYPRREK